MTVDNGHIYADFAQILISEAIELCRDDDLGLDLKNTVYVLDASTIDLCMSQFPWMRFRQTKSAIRPSPFDEECADAGDP